MAEPLDLKQPLPDRAHEAIRLAVLAAILDIEWNTADAELSLDLADTGFQLLATVQADVAALQEWRASLAAASGDVLDVVEVAPESVTTADADGVETTTAEPRWTWTRTAANGEEISRGEDYSRESDAWRGGHRANPDL